MSNSPTLSGAIAGEIRAEMARQLRTTVELAEALDLKPRAVQRRLAGDMEFSLDEIDAVASFLGVSREQLLTGVRPLRSVA